MSEPLVVSGIVKRFGGVVALNGVSLTVASGELVGLIGPNGSGKTTLLNVISGFYAPDQGTIRYRGRTIARHEPAEIARSGVARSFQVTKVFRRLTVLENMLVPGLLGWSVTPRAATGRAMRILADLRLERLAQQRASQLSGGQARLLEFGRLMMLEPTLVLLDEPFAGVHPELKAF
ncbi:MAG TPA: ATP-binding cassette domain-containing protein, partial [Thermodesulfobacteriota bacterium]